MMIRAYSPAFHKISLVGSTIFPHLGRSTPVPGSASFLSRRLFSNFGQELLEFLSQDRHNFEEVFDNPIIRLLENGSIRVLVDGHDDFSRSHSGKVLDGSGYTASNIQVGGNHFSRLSHLIAMIPPSGINCRPRGSNGSMDHVGKPLQNLKILRSLHSPSAGNDDLRLGQVPLGSA